jgi:cytochrome c biogenesis protein CcmG/thiol:disulfide interchange protein DsbE
MKGLKFFIPIASFLVLVGIFYVGLYEDPTRVPSPFIDKPAPDFSLPSLYDPDQLVSKADMAGQIVLLNVWASWCPACVGEHQVLLQIAAVESIPVYGLNWKDGRADGIRWLQQLGNPYTAIAHDPDNVVGIDYGVYGAPETFLIDANGIIRHKLIGPMTTEIWQQEFLPLIEQARAEGAG